MGAEKRKHARHSFERPAWVCLARGRPRPCIVRDISISGARLTMAYARDLPDKFQLNLSENGRVARKCRVAWRSDSEAGVEFLTRLVSLPAQQEDVFYC